MTYRIARCIKHTLDSSTGCPYNACSNIGDSTYETRGLLLLLFGEVVGCSFDLLTRVCQHAQCTGREESEEVGNDAPGFTHLGFHLCLSLCREILLALAGHDVEVDDLVFEDLHLDGLVDCIVSKKKKRAMKLWTRVFEVEYILCVAK